MTSFAITCLQAPINVGQAFSFGVFTAQLNSTVATGGDTIDLSSYFKTIYDVRANVGTEKTNFRWLHGVVGTADASLGGVDASSATGLKMVTYWDKGSSAGAFAEAAGQNASDVDKITLLVFGVAV